MMSALLVQAATQSPFSEIQHWVVQLVMMRIVIAIQLFESLREYGA
jgi:hypothetical protein